MSNFTELHLTHEISLLYGEKEFSLVEGSSADLASLGELMIEENNKVRTVYMRNKKLACLEG